ncbi:MAG: tetratricopeptide repeat protein [Planctomycetota bacterium]|jgi:TolA-binding protein
MARKGIWLGVLATILPVGTGLTAIADVAKTTADNGAELRDYYSANGLLNRGLHELAVTEYRKFLQSHGEHERAPTARYGLAVCLYRLERYDEAADELKQLLVRTADPTVQPSSQYAAEVATILGQCKLAQERYAEAAQAFQEVIQNHSQHDLADDAAAGAAEALYLDGRYDEAITKCRLFVSRWPTSPLRERIEFFWGLAAMAQLDYETAAQRFSGMLTQYPAGQFADEASLRLAQCYHHNNLTDQAVRQFRKVLERTGTRFLPDALLGLGTLLLQQGRPQEAGKLFDKLIDRHSDSPLAAPATFRRGRAWFEQGDYDRALTVLRSNVEQQRGGPLEDDVAYWIAKCRLRQEHFADAARRFAAAIEKFPSSDLLAVMHYDHAIALLRNGALDDGIGAFESFRKRFPGHGMAGDALYLLASTEHEQGRYDKSQAYCRAFLEQYPSHESSPAITYLSAENDFLQSRYAEAADGYRRFLTQYPQDSQATRARFRLGTAFYRLESFDEAEPLFAEVVTAEADGPFRFGLFALGDIYFHRGGWKKAGRFLGDYLSSGVTVPSGDDALLKLGLALQRQGNHAEALRAYDRFVQHFDDSPHRLQVIFERGQALVALERPDEAKAAFEQVLAEGSDSRFRPYALNHLASIAMQQDNFTTAAELFESVVSADAESLDEAESLFSQGQALLGAGRLRDAERVFSSLLDSHPTHALAAQACARLAITHSRQDRHGDALNTIERVEREFANKLDEPLRTSLQYEKAWSLKSIGRTEEAAAVYRNLLTEEKDTEVYVHALLELATIEAEAKRYEPAAELLRQLRRTIANTPSAVPDDVREQQAYRLAVCEFELGGYAQAAEHFEEFIALFLDSPLIASASLFCGEALHRTGKQDRAVIHLQRVVEDFPSDPAYGPSLLRLGQCLAELQRWPRSEQVFGEYLNRFANSDQWFQAQFGLGWARENQNRHDEAIRAYKEVVARHKGPTAGRAQFQIGECLFAGRKYEEAARELLKVDILYAYPEWSAAALYEAGQCFEKLVKPAEARAQFEAVVEKFAGTRWAEMASQRLAGLATVPLPGR